MVTERHPPRRAPNATTTDSFGHTIPLAESGLN